MKFARFFAIASVLSLSFLGSCPKAVELQHAPGDFGMTSSEELINCLQVQNDRVEVTIKKLDETEEALDEILELAKAELESDQDTTLATSK